MACPVSMSMKLVADGAVMSAGGACMADAGVSKPCSISFSVLYGNEALRMDWGRGGGGGGGGAAAKPDTEPWLGCGCCCCCWFDVLGATLFAPWAGSWSWIPGNTKRDTRRGRAGCCCCCIGIPAGWYCKLWALKSCRMVRKMGEIAEPRAVPAPPRPGAFMPVPDIWKAFAAMFPDVSVVLDTGGLRPRLEVPAESVWCTRSGCTADTDSGWGGKEPSTPGPKPPTVLPPPKKFIW